MPEYKIKRDQLYVKGFFHEVWKLNIYVVMCKDRHRLRDFLAVNHDGPFDQVKLPTGFMAAYLLRHKNGNLISAIAIPQEFDWNNPLFHASLAHESVHSAIALHRMRGIYLPTCGKDPEVWDDECLCYTVDWIMMQCYDMIQNKEKHKWKFSDELPVKK